MVIEFYKKNWRWFVLSTLFLATFLNYFNRQTLGTAIDPISKEFGLNNILRGKLLAAFTLTYAITHLFIGIKVDRVKNMRMFFPIMIIGWSLSSMVFAFIHTYHQMIFLRYLLGIFEAANFPVCLLIISRIFPASERSLASGIFASGAFLATLAAPPIVIYFSNAFNWRYSFIVSGGLGFFWLIPWFIIFKKPELRSSLWLHNASYVKEEIKKYSFRRYFKEYASVLKQPGFWGVALIGIGIVPCLYFATLWFPSYFTESLKVPFNQKLALKLGIIYLMQDLGLWIGGGIVLHLANRGWDILKARKVVIYFAWVLMMCIILVPIFDTITSSVVLFSCFVFGLGVFLGNQHAFKQDILKSQVGTVSAFVGFIETTFTFFVLSRIGIMINGSNNFNVVFITLAALASFALVPVFTLIKSKWVRVV